MRILNNDPLPAYPARDGFGRRFHYLRLSVTEACNFKCRYCLPFGFTSPPQTGIPFTDNPLSLSEIGMLVDGLAESGFQKVRLTGGEPTLRKDITEIVRRIAEVPGISTVALTTNGYRLKGLLPELKAAGLSGVNISLDSLDPGRFQQITGSPLFARVYAGVLEALELGIPSVKINAVLLRGYIERDLELFLRFVEEYPVAVRFIELMETGDNGDFFRSHYVGADQFCATLHGLGWHEIPRGPLSGPAVELASPHAAGRLGVIAPYSRDFCTTCNRLRVSSRGGLRLCLFGEGEAPLRPYLQHAAQRTLLQQTLFDALSEKPVAHRLHEGVTGSTRHLASIGG